LRSSNEPYTLFIWPRCEALRYQELRTASCKYERFSNNPYKKQCGPAAKEQISSKAESVAYTSVGRGWGGSRVWILEVGCRNPATGISRKGRPAGGDDGGKDGPGHHLAGRVTAGERGFAGRVARRVEERASKAPETIGSPARWMNRVVEIYLCGRNRQPAGR